MVIRKLSENVISQIAAGEVIERPSSVIRELLDNCLDAGAKEVAINLTLGSEATAFVMEVSDDGVGISREDLPLAFERHATSKIEKVEDIFSCSTMGFRGEALASIASVASLTIQTAMKAGEGYELTCRGGELGKLKKITRARGTTMRVSELFYNLPVRQGFLKSLAAEKSEIKREIIFRALAHEGVGFTLKSLKVGEAAVEELRIPQGLGLREKIHLLFGSRIEKELLELPGLTTEKIKVTGFVTGAHFHGKSRREQFFFYKKRPIVNSTLSAAFSQAYLNLLPGRTYPACVLMIEMNGTEVDVNVHPQKKDVRFRDTDLIFRAVFHKVKDTLLAKLKSEGKNVELPTSAFVSSPPAYLPGNVERQTSLFGLQESSGSDKEFTYRLKPSADEYVPLVKNVEVSSHNSSVPNFRVLGQIGKLFIAYVIGRDFYLADGHALHERIHFDRLAQRLNSRELSYQDLLVPLVLDRGVADASKILAMKETFEPLGLYFENFGQGKIKLERVPDYLDQKKSGEIIHGLIDEVLEVNLKNRAELREKALSTIACRMSIMSGDELTLAQMHDLIVLLYEKDYVHLCPHGRPFVKKIDFEELCGYFGREAK